MSALVTKKNADFGKKLVEAAEQAEQDRLQKLVVGRIQDILASIRAWNDRVEWIKEGIATLEARVSALKANKFTLSNDGAIKYDEEKLNERLPGGEQVIDSQQFEQYIKYGGRSWQ